MKNSQKLTELFESNSDIYKEISITDFSIADSPDNYLDVWITYKNIPITVTNFHFIPRSNLSDPDNWELYDSRAIHGVDSIDLINGSVCDCGKVLMQKYTVSERDFCKVLSQMDFKLLVLSKVISNHTLLRKIQKKADSALRKRYISCYHDIDKLDEREYEKIKYVLLKETSIEYVKKVDERRIDVYFNITGPVSVVMKNMEYYQLEENSTIFSSALNSQIIHRRHKEKFEFCPLCLSDYTDVNGESTICHTLTTKEHLTMFAELLSLSDINNRGIIQFLKSANSGDTFKITTTDTPYVPHIKLSNLKDAEKFFTAIKKGKLGRNDPCFCGSGKKSKKCCENNIFK